MPTRHDDRDATAHRLPHPDAWANVDRWITRYCVTLAEQSRDLEYRCVIGGSYVLDPEFVADLWSAVSDSEVVDAHEHEAPGNVMLGLAVSAVTGKPHVVVTTRVTATRHGEDHWVPLRQPIRRWQEHRRGDV